MDILISNLLSESIFDFGKWSNGKYTNTHYTKRSYLDKRKTEKLMMASRESLRASRSDSAPSSSLEIGRLCLGAATVWIWCREIYGVIGPVERLGQPEQGGALVEGGGGGEGGRQAVLQPGDGPAQQPWVLDGVEEVQEDGVAGLQGEDGQELGVAGEAQAAQLLDVVVDDDTGEGEDEPLEEGQVRLAWLQGGRGQAGEEAVQEQEALVHSHLLRLPEQEHNVGAGDVQEVEMGVDLRQTLLALAFS